MTLVFTGSALDFVTLDNDVAGVGGNSTTALANVTGATLMAWYKPIQPFSTTRQIIYFEGGTGNPRLTLESHTNGRVVARARRLDSDPTQIVQSATGAFVVGQLYHIAIVADYAHQTLTLHKNGSLGAAPLPVPSWTGTTSNTAGFANLSFATQPAGCQLHDVRVYNRALTTYEISRIGGNDFSFRGRDSIVHGMVGRYPLVEGRTGHAPTGVRGELKNSGGGAGHAVLANGTVFVPDPPGSTHVTWAAALAPTRRRRRCG